MLRVIVRQARPGMTLARSIINPRQTEQVLLSAGYKLDARTIARLHELGVYDLWINFDGLEFLDDLFSPALTTHQQRLCETLQESFQQQARHCDVALPVQQYKGVVEDLVFTLMRSAATLPFMSVLTGVDDALLRHSSEVCVLSLMLGLRLDAYLIEQRKHRMNCRYAKEVVNLGLGCMLHDVGELQLPESDRESRRSLFETAERGGEWQRHAELGFTALRGQIDASAATILLNHHQHFDGSGFPRAPRKEEPQAGHQIHVFARIAMAADTLQNLLHEDGVPQPTVKALWKIQQSPLRQWIDPVVLEALLAVVHPFIPGMLVTLSNRKHAIVTRTNENFPCYPEVAIINGQNLLSESHSADPRETVDLSKEKKLHIQAVDGSTVTDYLYGSRGAVAELEDCVDELYV
jgi:HD-GYP domain-containing protein (c-di-GMP phosphodiesterase class II)